MPDYTGTAKLALRDQLLTARRRRGLAEIGERARAVADHLLASPDVRRAATVAAYVSVSSEPGTGPLLEALRGAGKRVLLPLLQPDDDLDWTTYDGPASLRTARRGLLEPTGAPLGPDAVATADVVVVPGLAVARDGMRLGRGGGSYDRALGRVPVGTPVIVVLNGEEVLDRVPTHDHDRPVTAVVTEQGLTRLPAPAAGGPASRP
ncbi:MAG: 5-formyltetrahydrofolate cyclo-ligase [Marmoricola sp.]|nr:5-formyltetrahydrofolate cyclo-ligase [Marmoricola sp.]